MWQLGVDWLARGIISRVELEFMGGRERAAHQRRHTTQRVLEECRGEWPARSKVPTVEGMGPIIEQASFGIAAS